MIRLLLTALSLLLLHGCASISSGLATAVHTMVELNKPVLSLNDDSNAGWVRDAKATVSLRTPQFFANSKVTTQMLAACKAGKWVEVLVYAGGAQDTAALKGSCVQVYVSDNPELSRGFDVLLLDGDTVVTEGRMVAVVNAASRQEYQFRQFAKRNSRQLN